jgi:UDP-N-acetylglucosamine 2-epimerase
MTIVGTRPEIIKLSRVIPLLDQYSTHLLAHTGQNYDFELNEIFFRDLGIRRPDFFMNAPGSTSGETIGNIISRSYDLMLQTRPDCLLLYGDTNSCLSVISAKKLKVPVFHLEAGNRCFDSRVPEESNRKVVDHLSDVNLTITEHARRNLLAEGLRPDLTFAVGSSMPEVLSYYRPQIQSSLVLSELSLTEKGFFLVSAHREENVDCAKTLANLLESLDFLAERYQLPIIFSVHPRTQQRLKALGIQKTSGLIRFLSPLGFFDYVRLQQCAYCVLSDSGTITEEAALLGIPAVTIRQAHERPEGVDRGVLIMSDIDPKNIGNAVELAVKLCNRGQARLIDGYDNLCLAETVVKIISGYTGYINRTVWRSQNGT